MEKRSNVNIGIGDLIFLAVEIVFLIGMLTFLKPCDPMEDGSYMTCHWAGQAEIGLAAVLVVIALIHLCVPSPKTKLGIGLAAIPVAILALVLPNHLIHMCMMDDMRCQAVMRPGVIVFAFLTVAAVICDGLLRRRKAAGQTSEGVQKRDPS